MQPSIKILVELLTISLKTFLS